MGLRTLTKTAAEFGGPKDYIDYRDLCLHRRRR